MTIGDRIKSIRGRLSRDKFAPQTGISKTTLVNYETGERTPPSDYLVKILELYPDISPAWLLTGEGSRERYKPDLTGSRHGMSSFSFNEKYRKIRGNLTAAEFAERIGISENEVELLEKGEFVPDIYMVSALCFRFNISPLWLLEDMGPMTKDEMEHRPQYHIDPQAIIIALFTARSVKKAFKANGKTMTDDQWINVLISSYETHVNSEDLIKSVDAFNGEKLQED